MSNSTFSILLFLYIFPLPFPLPRSSPPLTKPRLLRLPLVFSPLLFPEPFFSRPSPCSSFVSFPLLIFLSFGTCSSSSSYSSSLLPCLLLPALPTCSGRCQGAISLWAYDFRPLIKVYIDLAPDIPPLTFSGNPAKSPAPLLFGSNCLSEGDVWRKQPRFTPPRGSQSRGEGKVRQRACIFTSLSLPFALCWVGGGIAVFPYDG